jgi:hypothetical protein
LLCIFLPLLARLYFVVQCFLSVSSIIASILIRLLILVQCLEQICQVTTAQVSRSLFWCRQRRDASTYTISCSHCRSRGLVQTMSLTIARTNMICSLIPSLVQIANQHLRKR